MKLLQIKLLITLAIIAICSVRFASGASLNFSQKNNSIKFSNRARCAADSKLPTSSAYILLNNIAPAKAVLKLSKIRNQDSEKFTRYGIQVYRYAMMAMIKDIHKKIVNSELPLLPAQELERVKTPLLQEYVDLTKSCKFKKNCEEMDSFISRIWNDVDVDKDDWRGSSTFLDEKSFEGGGFDNQINCHVIKKQSPFHSGILAAKPNVDSLEKIALITKNENDYQVSCDDYATLDNLEVATYKINIPSLKNRKWKKKGFDYWNSLKLYLSWAFRNSSEMDRFAYPFADIFRAVRIEDTIMIVSDNCRSINKPECSQERLVHNSIREMTKKDYLKKASHTDFLSDVPVGVSDKLLKERIPNLTIDSLDTKKFQDADKWLKNLSDNFSKTRSFVKRRLLSSLNKLKVINSQLKPEFFSNDDGFTEIDKQEAYALCTEHYYANHKSFSFLKNKIKMLSEVKFLDELVAEHTGNHLQKFTTYYEDLSSNLSSLCKKWEDENYWSESFEPRKEKLKSWYLKKVYEGKYKSEYVEATNGICSSETDCARTVIESMVKLYASTQYAHTFLNLKEEIKSPELFNPYHERVACDIYDPWFKTRSSILSLLWDVGQAAISPLNTGIIYTKASLSPKHVKSFNQLVKDGEIIFDKAYDKEKVMLSLGVDFGPLLGVPCDIAINKTNSNIYDYYRFNGITVGTCIQKEKYNLAVKSAGDIGDNKKNGYSGCLRCRLHFDTVVGSIGRFVRKIGSSFFLFRGIVRLVRSLKDPENIPRSWSVNPSYVLQTYNRFGGKIPKKCVSLLSKGRRCLKNTCLETLSHSIDKMFSTNVTKISGSNGVVKIQLRNCKNPIELNYEENNNYCSVSGVISIPEKCKDMLRSSR